MTTRIDPRAITDAEQPFLDQLDSFEAMARLQRRIIDAGHSWAIASGTCAHLMALKTDDPELLPNTESRRRYRNVLRELVEQDRPKGRRRRKAAAEAGYAESASVVGIAAGAAAGAVASAVAGPAAALVGPPVALYVTRNPRADDHEQLAAVVELRPASRVEDLAKAV
jgi:hypothetical protein